MAWDRPVASPRAQGCRLFSDRSSRLRLRFRGRREGAHYSLRLHRAQIFSRFFWWVLVGCVQEVGVCLKLFCCWSGVGWRLIIEARADSGMWRRGMIARGRGGERRGLLRLVVE